MNINNTRAGLARWAKLSARALSIFMALLLYVATFATAAASGFERLLMPGPVIEGHAEIETDCGACHDAQTDTALASLCIACHEDIGQDRKTRRGFHGTFKTAQQSKCVVCHTDHEGRSADIVPFEAMFDHNLSDFPLRAAHLAASCTDCHSPEEKYRDASSSCGTCHADEDVHDGSLGRDCQSCHGAESWSNTRFDHNTVGYRLIGEHTTVACVDCHRGNRYDGTPTGCNSCHGIDDVHEGANGKQCRDCHSPATWRNIGFDHFKETGFALENGHRSLNCQDCHSSGDFNDDLSADCVSCHLSEDDHQGRNGRECESCHVTSSWSKSLFDHADTSFALHGSHAELHCTACHKGGTDTPLPLVCGACHDVDDSHGGQLGESCDSCHAQTKWNLAIAFDHDLSDFPLTGMHATAACGSCHESHQFRSATSACTDCHRSDDVHDGTLGEDCGACHTSNAWLATLFDHDTNTNFVLSGAHRAVQCDSCHRNSTSDMTDVPSSCGGCHKTDDVHAGQFGLRCDACHNTTTFPELDKR